MKNMMSVTPLHFTVKYLDDNRKTHLTVANLAKLKFLQDRFEVLYFEVIENDWFFKKFML